MSRAIIDLVEAAYDTAASVDEWCARVSTLFAERLSGAVATFLYTVETNRRDVARSDAAFWGGVADGKRLINELHAGIDPAALGTIYPVGTHSRFHTDVLPELHASGESPLAPLMVRFGCDDFLGISSIDASGRGLVLGAATLGARLSRRDHELHRRVAIHLAAGLRLRASLPSRDLLAVAEAVFEADGRLAEASGAATERARQEQLSASIAGIDAARTRSASRDDIAATELWRGLVDGRWSVIEHFDSDGRRFYVAIANPALGVDVRALTELERQVAAMVIAGETNKTIGYALGFAESTIATYLACALRKLGLAKRIDLINLAASLLPGRVRGPSTSAPTDG